MSDQRRADRVAAIIREEVALFLTSDARDPRLQALMTVTAVDVTRDLKHARIFVSMLGSESECAASLEALSDSGMTGHLRTRVSKVMRLRVAPELSFRLDESVARAARIESLLAQVREKKPGDGGAGN